MAYFEISLVRKFSLPLFFVLLVAAGCEMAQVSSLSSFFHESDIPFDSAEFPTKFSDYGYKEKTISPRVWSLKFRVPDAYETDEIKRLIERRAHELCGIGAEIIHGDGARLFFMAGDGYKEIGGQRYRASSSEFAGYEYIASITCTT